MKNDSRKTAAHANQETPPDDVPTVSSVIGDGENAHRIVRVGALEFVAAVGDDEPRMRDADFAERLGHARIRKIRETIARWEAEIGPILSRPAVGRGLFRGKTQESVTVREYLLTEAQALFIAAKSDTKNATALLREMIRVYMLARRGLLPQVDPRLLAEQTAMYRETIEHQSALILSRQRDLDIVRAENRTLREQQTNGTIPGMAADWIREQITVVAPMMAMLGWCPRKQTVRAARRVLQNGIAQAAGWGHERGQEIADMPTTGYPHARAYLKAKRESAEAEIAKRARDTKAAADAIMLARQGSLFAEPGANQNAGRAVS